MGAGWLERGLAEPGRGPQRPGRIRGWISPPRPHARGAGRAAFPPASLPLRQWEENWVRQLSPAAWREGGGAALQFPPDQQGLVWGEGGKETCGCPHPPHPFSTPLSLPLRSGYLTECPLPGLFPLEYPDSRAAACRPRFPALPSPGSPRPPHSQQILDQPVGGGGGGAQIIQR